MAVYRGSSTFFSSTAEQRATVDTLGLDYSYGLHGNPTQYTLAKRLAEIEEAEFALVCPSGLAGISLVAHGHLRSGDHWLIPENVYGPTFALASELKHSLNIDFDVYDPMDISDIESKLQASTRLVWLEAPGSFTFETPNLTLLIQTCVDHQESQGVARPLFALDNTYSAGLTFKPFDHGIDISVQALTKYQCGHADVLMGAVLARDEAAFVPVERQNRLWGLGVSPDDCSLVLRGLMTLPLRYKSQAQTAHEVAKWLSCRPEVLQVLHPAMDGTPGCENFRRLFSGSASLFSFVLRPEYPLEMAARFADSLRLFNIAYSWGGPESLVLIGQLDRGRLDRLSKRLTANQAPVTEAAQEKPGSMGPVIRLAIGLEAASDLIADLDQAFTQSTE